MPQSSFVRRVKVIVPVLSLAVVAAFVLAAWSFYSAHQQACYSRNQTLDVLRDIVLLATTSDPEHAFTQEERRRSLTFRAAVFARIDKARC